MVVSAVKTDAGYRLKVGDQSLDLTQEQMEAVDYVVGCRVRATNNQRKCSRVRVCQLTCNRISKSRCIIYNF